ncbi:MAG: energy-coupling factor transporter transmembrane protein EcfT [Propionibacteriaceae bacterium]|jgi:cobalt/nickel transport system permease protein/energy-coupling factor transport system permease protein|nr:energy-coupling factor transporter transmembrane protein EcfT [Propionibacteriaceae bacterium]
MYEPITPAGNAVQRANPLVVVCLVLCCLIDGLFIGSKYLLFFFPTSVVVVAVAGNLKRYLALLAAVMLPTATLMFVLQLLANEGGVTYWHWWIIRATELGFDNAIHYTARFVVIGTAVFTLICLVKLSRFTRALEQCGVNPRVTYVLQATVLIIPQMKKRVAVILDAQRARGIETDANLRVRMKALLPVAAPLILSALTSVEERAVSLEARGTTLPGKRTSLLQVNNSTFDKVICIVAVLICGGVIIAVQANWWMP